MGDNALKLEMALYGEGMRYIQSSPQAPAIIYAAKLNGLWLSSGAVAQLRKDLAITADITAEEDECALLERELEQAREDGVLSRWVCIPPHYRYNSWCYSTANANSIWFKHDGGTRILAARAAVAHVRELRAEAERTKLPDVQTMRVDECIREMNGLGWIERAGYRPQWVSPNHTLAMGDDETLIAFSRRALTEARRIDAAAK